MANFYLPFGEFVVVDMVPRGIEGINAKIEFIDFLPDPAAVVVLVQAVKCTRGPDLQHLTIPYPSGDQAGDNRWTIDNWAIDAPGNQVCPAFGLSFNSGNDDWSRWQQAKGSGSPGSDGRVGRIGSEYEVAAKGIKGGHGSYAYTQGTTLVGRDAAVFLPAMLDDRPGRRARTPGTAFHHQFESVALRISRGRPSLTGKVLGAICWGYTVDEMDPGVLAIDNPVVTSTPSATWIAAAEQWHIAKPDRRSIIPGRSVKWAG